MENKNADGTSLADVQIGQEVEIVQKHHQRSGELTWGIVKRILTLELNPKRDSSDQNLHTYHAVH